MRQPYRILFPALLAFALGAVAQRIEAPSAFAPPNLTDAGVRAMAANCASCHGTLGRPVRGSNVPALAGRSAAEIADVMAQYKEGKRNATVMHQIAKGYTDLEIHYIARYFSQLER
jgi:cytochrome c553